MQVNPEHALRLEALRRVEAEPPLARREVHEALEAHGIERPDAAVASPQAPPRNQPPPRDEVGVIPGVRVRQDGFERSARAERGSWYAARKARSIHALRGSPRWGLGPEPALGRTAARGLKDNLPGGARCPRVRARREILAARCTGRMAPVAAARFRHWLSRFRPTPTQTVHSERLGPEMVDRGREMLPCARRPTPQHEQRGAPRGIAEDCPPWCHGRSPPEPAAGSAHPPPCSWANPTQARLSPGTGPAQRPIQHRGLSSTEAYPAQRLIQRPDPLAVHRGRPLPVEGRWHLPTPPERGASRRQGSGPTASARPLRGPGAALGRSAGGPEASEVNRLRVNGLHRPVHPHEADHEGPRITPKARSQRPDLAPVQPSRLDHGVALSSRTDQDHVRLWRRVLHSLEGRRPARRAGVAWHRSDDHERAALAP